MRIVYVTARLPYTAAETFIAREIDELLRQGHEVLIVPRSPAFEVPAYARALLPRTVAQRTFSASVAKACVAKICQSPGAALGALNLVLKSRLPKTLVKNLAIFPKGIWLGRVAHEWKAAHIHAHWGATPATMALVASRVCGVPWSFTAHRYDIVENNLLTLKLREAAFARFISRSGMEMARAAGVGGLDRKAHLLHMGVSLPARPSAAHAPAHPSVLLCPANLQPVKGHQYLIAALALLRDRGIRACLWIAGSGELREQLERQVAELRLGNRVRFLGQVSHPELMRLYQDGKVGIVVLPSVDLGDGLHEGIPVSLMEAMAYDIPVVSTNTGGIPELLHGDAGLMVPPQDPVALAQALESLMKNAALRVRLAEAGRKRVEQEFAIDRVVAKLAKLFHRGMTSIPELEDHERCQASRAVAGFTSASSLSFYH
jgi:glycosyltransferase involved in cell wall biosynthesis